MLVIVNILLFILACCYTNKKIAHQKFIQTDTNKIG